MDDQAIEEMRHHPVVACLVAILVFFLKEGGYLGPADLVATQPDDVDKSRVADVQQIAEAAEHVVVGHGYFTLPTYLEAGNGLLEIAENDGRAKGARWGSGLQVRCGVIDREALSLKAKWYGIENSYSVHEFSRRAPSNASTGPRTPAPSLTCLSRRVAGEGDLRSSERWRPR